MVRQNAIEILRAHRIDPAGDQIADRCFVNSCSYRPPAVAKLIVRGQCRLTKRPDSSPVKRRDGESADMARMIFVPSPGITLTRPARIAA